MNVQARFQELSKVFSLTSLPASTAGPSIWSPPPSDHIKINVDAALDSTKSALAVVAQNHLGKVLFLWGKVHHLCSPMIAEASALLWAVQLASQQRWRSVIFEGDAKICFDALNHPYHNPNLALNTLIYNIRSLSSFFLSCSFCWVWRDSNYAAHVSAKFALNSRDHFCFSNGNLPPSLESVCKGDASCCSSV